MKDTFLKIAGVKNEQDFYKKYPTEDAFFKAHPEAVKMKQGGAVDLNAFYNQPRFVQTNIFQDGGEPDGSMALTQINAMMDRLQNLQKFIQKESDLDPWISDKLSVMNHSASAINDYMMYGDEGSEEDMMEMKNGGGIPARYKNMGFSRVGQKKESTRDGKKWMVLAKKGDDYKVVHGGYDGMKDFTQHGSEKRRDRFWDRMGGRDSAKAKDPFSPLYWHKRFGTWAEGGELLPEYQFAGEFITKNAWYKGEQPAVTGPNPNTSAVPPMQGNTPGTNPNAFRNGAPQMMTAKGLWNDKTFNTMSDLATLPLTGVTAGLGNRGIGGILKGAVGAAAFLGGLGTGVDNIYRGFKPRETAPTPGPTAGGTKMDWNDPKNAAALNQESVQQEMQRKQQNQMTPPMPNTVQPPVPYNDERNRTAAYGGLVKAEYGTAVPWKPGQLEKLKNSGFGPIMGVPQNAPGSTPPAGGSAPNGTVAGPTQWGIDYAGASRAMGAAAGLGMLNDVIGYNQAFKNLESNQVRAGMSDSRGVSDPWLQQGYDVLNTGPGQTQAPNLYVAMQHSGGRQPGFFQEGGEYEMTEDEIRQFLAMGGEIEFVE